MPGAVDGGDQDSAGSFTGGVVDEIREAGNLGAADIIVAEGGEVGVAFDGAKDELHLSGEAFAQSLLLVKASPKSVAI